MFDLGPIGPLLQTRPMVLYWRLSVTIGSLQSKGDSFLYLEEETLYWRIWKSEIEQMSAKYIQNELWLKIGGFAFNLIF